MSGAIQSFGRWQPVEVLHGDRWMPAIYTRPMDAGRSIFASRLISVGLVHNAIPDHGDGEAVDEFAYKDEHVRPMPIRRGDVVQCIRDCRADEGDGMYAVKDVSVTDGLTPGGRLLLYGRRFDPGSFARIGRARYYPDGTPVEN